MRSITSLLASFFALSTIVTIPASYFDCVEKICGLSKFSKSLLAATRVLVPPMSTRIYMLLQKRNAAKIGGADFFVQRVLDERGRAILLYRIVREALHLLN